MSTEDDPPVLAWASDVVHPDGSEEIKIKMILEPHLEPSLRTLAIHEALTVAKALLTKSISKRD